MCLALAELPSVCDPLEAAWRVSAAYGLMKAGVAPATIAAALMGEATPLRREYDPNQPRVAAGNGEQSGRWTKEGDSGAGRPNRPSSPNVQLAGEWTCDVNNKTAKELGMTRTQLGDAIHNLKDGLGLGDADQLRIHLPTGDVYFNGECVGNLHDE